MLFSITTPGTFADDEKKQKGIDKIEQTKGFCRLIIDGKQVSQTRVVPIQWPNMELDILDQFQIHVFTLPAKVQLEVYL